MLIDVTYLAGTQKSPQQTDITTPCFTDTDKVHFRNGRLSTIPAYSTAGVVSDYVELIGAVRTIHAHKFSGAFSGSCYLMGGSSRLYVVKNSNLYNITPFANQKNEKIGANPLEVSSGDATLTVTYTAHGLSVGDLVTLSGATGFHGISAASLNSTFLVDTVPDADTFTVEMDTTATNTGSDGGDNVSVFSIEAAAVLGTNPISTTSGDATVTVTYTSHGLAIGDRIKLFGATATGGLTTSELNAEHIVATVPTANTFTFEASSNASSTATGGGSAVSIFTPMAAGNINQEAASGYGTGIYGEGIYGIGGEAVTAQNYPRIWSFGDFGDNIVMCAGDYTAGDGQKIYLWDGDTSTAPTVLLDAPTDCNFVMVVNNSIVALCEKTIKIAEIGRSDIWSGLLYYENEVQRAWRLIAGCVFNEKEALIFSPNFVVRLRYVGGQDIWDVSDVTNEDGLLAPNACCVLNSVLYWRGARGSYRYAGSFPERIENSQNDDWQIENINLGQAWKSFAFADAQNNEWYLYFPTGADSECGDYVIHNPMPMNGLPFGSFTLGRMERTAAQHNGILDGLFYMADAYEADSAGAAYLHLTTGAVTFSWSATTSLAYAGDGDYRIMIDKFYPDSNQSGDATLIVRTAEYAQGTISSSPSYTVSSSSEYTSVRAAGKLVGIQLSGSSRFDIGAWKMNLQRLGRR